MSGDYREQARARIREIRGGPTTGAPYSDQVLAAGRAAYERISRLSDAYSGGTFLIDEMVTAVLAECVPLLDRVDVATAATIAPAGALEIGPADTLVLKFSVDVTLPEVEGWRNMLRERMPHLDGRVLFVVCDEMAVVRGVDVEQAPTDQEGTPE